MNNIKWIIKNENGWGEKMGEWENKRMKGGHRKWYRRHVADSVRRERLIGFWENGGSCGCGVWKLAVWKKKEVKGKKLRKKKG